MPRMVSTPWSDKPVTFEKAAEIGTQKVIKDHSTIGIVVATDGSVTDIPRENYVQAEKRVVSELKEIGKSFVVASMFAVSPKKSSIVSDGTSTFAAQPHIEKIST